MDLNGKDLEYLTQGKTFYKGVIEDNQDPLHMGRVKVRLFGIHSPSLVDVPTETLPWANVLQSLAFGGFNSGNGISGVPIQGTWVWCFVDFNDTNNIIVLGAISGINSQKMVDQGFVDPSGVYPLTENLGKPDINQRVITGGYTDTYTIQTPGKHIIEINDLTGEILIKHTTQGSVKLSNLGIDINANSNASTNIQLRDNGVNITHNSSNVHIYDSGIDVNLDPNTSIKMSSGVVNITGNVNVVGNITTTGNTTTKNITALSLTVGSILADSIVTNSMDNAGMNGGTF